MKKVIKFEKVYKQSNDDLMKATVKESGIILGYGEVMSVKEVEEWICGCYEHIKEKKEDMRVAEAAVALFKKEFGK